MCVILCSFIQFRLTKDLYHYSGNGIRGETIGYRCKDMYHNLYDSVCNTRNKWKIQYLFVVVKRHVPFFGQSEKRKRKGKKTRIAISRHHKLVHQCFKETKLVHQTPTSLISSLPFSFPLWDWPFFYAGITVPPSKSFPVILFSKKGRERKARNTKISPLRPFDVDGRTFTARRWRRRRHCRWSPPCSWRAWSRAGWASPRWTWTRSDKAAVRIQARRILLPSADHSNSASGFCTPARRAQHGSVVFATAVARQSPSSSPPSL